MRWVPVAAVPEPPPMPRISAIGAPQRAQATTEIIVSKRRNPNKRSNAANFLDQSSWGIELIIALRSSARIDWSISIPLPVLDHWQPQGGSHNASDGDTGRRGGSHTGGKHVQPVGLGLELVWRDIAQGAQWAEQGANDES